MKTGALANAFVAVGALLAGTAGGHPLANKRDLVTDVVFVTQTVANVIVFVDENGVPYMTSTADLEPAASSVSASPTAVSTSTFFTPTIRAPDPTAVSTSTFSAPTTVAPDPTAVSISTFYTPTLVIPDPAPPSSMADVSSAVPPPLDPAFSILASPPAPGPSSGPQAQSDDRLPLGITYDTYKGQEDHIDCKTTEEMTSDFESMKSYGIVRIYGNDCGVIPVAIQQARKNGQKIMGGIYSPNQRVDDVVNDLADAVKQYNDGNWDIVSVVSVENERVYARVQTASDAQDTIAQAREALRNAGFQGPVGAVEPVPAIVDNPAICDTSDLVLVNVHAFFDTNTKAENAGSFVTSEVARVQKACNGKRVVVTESGWPHQGTSHDQAVVSRDAQQAALSSIRQAFDHDLFLFNAYDSLWKSDDSSTFNSEKYWGIM